MKKVGQKGGTPLFWQMEKCPFCENPAELVHVHGHYQCKYCGTNAMPCCDGDNAETNVLLREEMLRPFDINGKQSYQFSERIHAHCRNTL